MTTRLSRFVASQAPGSSLARVLVVDDTAAGRDALSRQVEMEGYVADAAAQGGEALEKLRAEPFDLVLVNVRSAAVGGPQLLEAVRSDAALEHLAVIVVSPADDVEVVTQCLELGADDYLPMASPPAILRARLSAALAKRRVRAAESLAREMAVARNIQRDFLPESLPLARGLQLEAALHPARQVSGDFYDAFGLGPSGTIVLVVGDVCDKGVGAALFMALFRSLIRASADPVEGGAIQMIGGRRTLVRESLEAATPADLLTRVAGFTNNYIAKLHGRTNMFATVFLGALSPMTGQFDYVNAGHEPALVVAPDGGTRELRPTGTALGLLPDAEYTAGQAKLVRGESIFAFTDGLVEAPSPAGEAFGKQRLRDALRANNTSAANLVRGVVAALRAFTGPAEPHDDLTLLAATRTID
ncbi:MAG TPA: SpoIIE family protein phosphatase [Gemmatimonadales bacterium]|nr:SpoIIE family protein phosphatase [Gemmatimonadales bacterium]